MRKRKTIKAHKEKCEFSRPPGELIYFDRNVKSLNDPSLQQPKDEQTYINSVSVF
jgi:hypothetical protein